MSMKAPSTDEKPVIIVDSVSKRFVQNEYRPSLRHEFMTLARRWLPLRRMEVAQKEQFWALRDVSFNVCRGESVGIVGHNGAGKSTLFRILCNISEPTTGSVVVHGNYAPLIALGAGFNIELTGRQNIYLSAAIQGLTIKQINKIVPEVIAFSELEDFIELPVKRYSSGMVARLGFSVAIQTLPDIIFLDEILSVGDMAFQIKCKQRIQEFIAQKRTLLFVSHAASEVRRICTRAIWLDHGQIIMDSNSDDVVDAYEAAMNIPNTRQMAAAAGLF